MMLCVEQCFVMCQHRLYLMIAQSDVHVLLYCDCPGFPPQQIFPGQ